jgi:hypothetical protein
MVDEGGLAMAWQEFAVPKLSGTVKSILGRGERRWDRMGAVYASDVCQQVPGGGRRCVLGKTAQFESW